MRPSRLSRRCGARGNRPLRGSVQRAKPIRDAHELSSDVTSVQELDVTDIAILAEFQNNGRISKNELAYRVGISPLQCLRRLRVLQGRGIIKGVRALIDPQLLNYELVFFTMIRLHSQSQRALDEFDRFVESQTIVRESWLLAGDVDYILKCIGRDLAAIRQFVSALTVLPNVRTIRTSLELRNIKDSGIVPFKTA